MDVIARSLNRKTSFVNSSRVSLFSYNIKSVSCAHEMTQVGVMHPNNETRAVMNLIYPAVFCWLFEFTNGYFFRTCGRKLSPFQPFPLDAWGSKMSLLRVWGWKLLVIALSWQSLLSAIERNNVVYCLEHCTCRISLRFSRTILYHVLQLSNCFASCQFKRIIG